MPRVPRVASLISAVVAFGGFAACGPTEGGILLPGFGVGAVVSIIVSPTAASIEVGSTLQMTATLVDGVGREVPGNASWSSSNDDVASVSDGGLVTGVAVGAATITATSGTVTREATVTVAVASGPPSS